MTEFLRTIQQELDRQLDRRRGEDAELRPTRVTARHSDGTVSFQPLTGDCIERGANCAVREGQIVERPCRPGFSLQGASGLAMTSVSREIATLDVVSQEPEAFGPGFVGTVTVTGVGLLPSFALDYLSAEPAGEVNPDITVEEIRVLDSETAELDVVVAADAEIPMELVEDLETGTMVLQPRPLPVAFDNVGAPL